MLNKRKRPQEGGEEGMIDFEEFVKRVAALESAVKRLTDLLESHIWRGEFPHELSKGV